MLGYSKKYADEYGLIGPTKDFEKGDFVFVGTYFGSSLTHGRT